jgi:CRP/FNR family transcriptional regulator, cyclic AMP receptor protein
MQTLDSILAKQPFFKGLEPEYLELLRGCASNASFRAGAYLFHEGDPASHFYIIRRGKVALETAAPQFGAVTIETIDAGEVLGWAWLFPPYRWTLSARAVEPTGVTMLDAPYLREKCESDYYFGYQLVKRCAAIIVRQLWATRLQLIDTYSTYPGERV